MNNTTTWAAGLAILLASATACGASDDAADQAQQTGDQAEQMVDGAGALGEVLAENGLSSIASALESIDLSELTDTPDYTFLAPSDEAFQAVDPEELAALLADPGAVTELLRNHMIAERLTASEVSELSSVETVAGNTLTVSAGDDGVMFDDATVGASDIEVGDGTVHVVDRLFLP